jgi:hypothetical protein
MRRNRFLNAASGGEGFLTHPAGTGLEGTFVGLFYFGVREFIPAFAFFFCLSIEAGVPAHRAGTSCRV